MARKLIKRIMPDPEWIKTHKSLQILGTWIHDPNLWHLNRHCVASAVFIGLFMSFVPVPTQMIIAALAAVAFHANLPISVMLVWISNPLTMAPIFYFAYQVGLVVTNEPAAHFDFVLSWEWVTNGLAQIWFPFLVGCFVCGLFFGLLGSTAIRIFWRWYVVKRWHERRLKNAQS